MDGPAQWLARLRHRPGEGNAREPENPADHAYRPDWLNHRGSDSSRNWMFGSIALSVLLVGFALASRDRPSSGPLPIVVPDLPEPDAMATLPPPFDIVATEPGSGASSEPAASDSPAAAPNAPPPVAVLKPDADAVLAAPPSAEPAAPAKRKPGPVLIFDAGASEGAADGDGAGGRVMAEPPKVSTAAAVRSARAAPLAAAASAQLSRGTLIPAVLESVIDASQPGGVRALVSTDVRTADGRGLLVPRSSRLVGQYRRGDGSTSGRAYVIWTRIEWPDGSRVALGAVGRDAARFHAAYASAPVVSQVGGNGTAAVRVRQGEPIRVVAARSVDVRPVGR